MSMAEQILQPELKPKGRFLSLKWKILARLGLLLTLINITVIFPTYDQHKNRLERQLAEGITIHSQDLLDQSRKHMVQLGNLIPFVAVRRRWHSIRWISWPDWRL